MEQVKTNEFAHSYLTKTEIHIFFKERANRPNQYQVMFPIFLKTGKMYAVNAYLDADSEWNMKLYHHYPISFVDTGNVGKNKNQMDNFAMSCFGPGVTSIRLPKAARQNINDFIHNYKVLALECDDLTQLKNKLKK